MKCGNVDNFFVRVEKRCVLSDFTAGFLWKDSCFPRYCLILWKTIHIKNRIKNRISGILLILGFRSHSFSARKQTQSNLCETKKLKSFITWFDADYEYDLEIENEDRMDDEEFTAWVEKNAEDLAKADR